MCLNLYKYYNKSIVYWPEGYDNSLQRYRDEGVFAIDDVGTVELTLKGVHINNDDRIQYAAEFEYYEKGNFRIDSAKTAVIVVGECSPTPFTPRTVLP